MTSKNNNTASKGFVWSFLESFASQGIQFVVRVYLARLLFPEQFGLIAMLDICMQVAQVLIESGFGYALIQKKDATHVDECSVFYFNILIGFAAAGAMYLAAPWIAAFYNAPMIEPLARVLSLSIIINSFGVVQVALLTKKIDFKAQAKASIISGIISGAIGIAMAYTGFGVWSLVWHYIALAFFRIVLYWVFCSWRPSWTFSFNSLRSMFPFASRLLLVGLLDKIYTNLFIIAIGKMYSPTLVGYYGQADQIVSFPARNLSSPISRVVFPIFSSIKEDKIHLKKEAKKVLEASALIHFPAIIGLAAVAKPLVLALLTEKWLPSVPYIQLICAAWILFPCQMINFQLLTALGRSDLFFRLDVFKKVSIAVVLIFTVPLGIMAILYGGVATSIIAYYISGYYTNKIMSYSMKEQIRDVSLVFLVSSVMGIVVFILGLVPMDNNILLFILGLVPVDNNILLLFVQVPTGVAVYIFMCRLLKLESYHMLMSYALEEYRKFKSYALKEYKRMRGINS